MADASTFPALLGRALHNAPGRPLLTAYDDATGDRVELSVATYANWVSKTANLLTDEYLLDSGDTVQLALPAHWLGAVFLGAAWAAGIAVTTEPDQPAHLVVCGPDVRPHTERDLPVLACALGPFATRFPGALPEGVDDYGVLWPGQPDVFVAGQTPSSLTRACRHGGTGETQAELLARAAKSPWQGDRLLTDLDPTYDCGVPTLLAALVRDGSLVLVSNPDERQWPARREVERATDVLRAGSAT